MRRGVPRAFPSRAPHATVDVRGECRRRSVPVSTTRAPPPPPRSSCCSSRSRRRGRRTRSRPGAWVLLRREIRLASAGRREARSRLVIVVGSMSMRSLGTATFAAGLALVVASPATAKGPPPTVPSDAAIAQYVEAVPSATGPVPVGEAATTAHAATLPPAVRGNVERTAGDDAPVLLHIAQDPRYGARPVARSKTAQARSDNTAQASSKTSAPPIHTPEPLAAAASTAGSGGLLLVALLLIAITAVSIGARVLRR